MDDRVQPVTVRLVAVERVVLERRDDALALDPVDRFGAEDGTEIRIFRVILEVAAVARIASEIDPAGELDVESATPRLAADRRATLARESWIEARSDDDGRRERGGPLVVRPVPRVGHAHARVAALDRRNTEPRDAGRIPCAHVLDVHGNARVARNANRRNSADQTDDQREALVVGHLRLRLTSPTIGLLFNRLNAIGDMCGRTHGLAPV